MFIDSGLENRRECNEKSLYILMTFDKTSWAFVFQNFVMRYVAPTLWLENEKWIKGSQLRQYAM